MTRNISPPGSPERREEIRQMVSNLALAMPHLFRASPPVASTCGTCYGYGMWWDGSGQPMGPMDGSDGMPTMACAECGANRNPVKDRAE